MLHFAVCGGSEAAKFSLSSDSRFSFFFSPFVPSLTFKFNFTFFAIYVSRVLFNLQGGFLFLYSTSRKYYKRRPVFIHSADSELCQPWESDVFIVRYIVREGGRHAFELGSNVRPLPPARGPG